MTPEQQVREHYPLAVASPNGGAWVRIQVSADDNCCIGIGLDEADAWKHALTVIQLRAVHDFAA